ncbi:MAG: hypothetical protein O2894_01260 [Planctomycetota bacterium]|nr:hypothetical protein [Planctomycetota bacterium]
MRRGCLLLLFLGLAACASDGPRPIDPTVDLYSPSGARRAQAVQAVAAQGDRRLVPELIPLLDDRDETVRLQTHAALKELTGHDTGYAPYEGRAERGEHVRAWEAWWADQGAPTEAPREGGGVR